MSQPTSKSLDKAIRAHYQVQPNLNVACYFDVVEATPQRVIATIGNRHMGDTVLLKGTRLYIDAHKMRRNFSTEQRFDLYYMNVFGTDSMGSKGELIHVCSPIIKEPRQDKRQHERFKSMFNLDIEGFERMLFVATQGNEHGMTLAYHSPRMLKGLTIYQRYKVSTYFRQELFDFEVEVVNLTYDWFRRHQMAGVKVTQADRFSRLRLRKLFDPTFDLDMSDHTNVDADEARIQGDD